MFKFSDNQKLLGAALALLMLSSLAGCQHAGSGAEAALEKAKHLIDQGNYTEAFLQLNQALEMSPQDPNIHLNLGWLYLYTDDLAHARAELKKVETLAPDAAETFHLRGSLSSLEAQSAKSEAQARKDHEAAVNDLKASLERNPKNQQTYFDLANSEIALGRYEEALGTLDKGFEYIPDRDLQIQLNYQIASCNAHAKLGMLEEAIADCKQAEDFTTNPDAKQQIADMIENMKLLSPGSVPERIIEIGPRGPVQSEESKQAEQAAIQDNASD